MPDYLDELSKRLNKLTPPNESFREAVESLKRVAGCGSAVREGLEKAMDALEKGNSTEFEEGIQQAFYYQESVSSASKEAENNLRSRLKTLIFI